MPGNRTGNDGRLWRPPIKPPWRVMRYRLVSHPGLGWAWRKEGNTIFKSRTKADAVSFCARYFCTPGQMVVASPKGTKLPDYFKVIPIHDGEER